MLFKLEDTFMGVFLVWEGNMKKLIGTLDIFDRIIWCVSSIIILISFFLFDRVSYLNLLASMIGVTSLILNAKGDPIGQLLMVIFSFLYAVISFKSHYYGEMITYLGMTMPMALFSLISWFRHPFKGKKREVEVNEISKREYIFMFIITFIVTVIFYFILKGLGTASLFFSTLSVTTSFAAAYLTFRRCRTFALAYAFNDIVLIVLWSIAVSSDRKYISVLICFIMFLANDLYGYYSWGKMKRRQNYS